LNNEPRPIDTKELQFLVKGGEGLPKTDLIAAYREVPLFSGNVILKSPKFPVNIINAVEEPYCSYNMTVFNATCAQACSCASRLIPLFKRSGN
jgi:hypothetical protein